MKYYLYIDDSGKFHKESDDFVLYSYILFTKKERKQFEENYVKTWWKIVNPKANYNSEKVFDDFINYDPYDKDLSLSQGILRENKNKAHSLFSKYNSAIKKKEQIIINQYESFFDCFRFTTHLGTIAWCKNCCDPDKRNWNSELDKMNKKKYMIMLILSNLFDKKILKFSDEINIYVDTEFNFMHCIDLNKDFMNYINLPIKSWEDVKLTGLKTPSMVYKLRINKIYCKNFEFIDSATSIFIRCADILANMSHKFLNQKNSPISPKHFYDFLTKNTKTNINWLKFPKIKDNIDIEMVRCNHSKDQNA